jgi:hypothetical protein
MTRLKDCPKSSRSIYPLPTSTLTQQVSDWSCPACCNNYSYPDHQPIPVKTPLRLTFPMVESNDAKLHNIVIHQIVIPIHSGAVNLESIFVTVVNNQRFFLKKQSDQPVLQLPKWYQRAFSLPFAPTIAPDPAVP